MTDYEMELIKSQIDRIIRVLDNLPCTEIRERVSRLEQRNANGKEFEEIFRYRSDKQLRIWGITITAVTILVNVLLRLI